MGFNYKTLSLNEFNLPSNWNVVTVDDVARINEISIKKNSQINTIEYIDIASVANGRVLGVQLIPLSKAPSRARRVVRNDDILISTVRPNLKHFTFIKKANPNTIASTGFSVITSYKVDPRYLYYYLTSEPFTNYLSQIADTHTSAYPAFNPDIIENAELLLPPPSEQHRIASILGALDDKIELNNEMNKTLEEMAQAIFKSWFVDFEPFQNGEFEYNDELQKEIPKGWGVVNLEDLVDISTKSIRPFEKPDTLYRHFSIPAFDEGRVPTIEKGEEIKSNKYVIAKDCVLVSKLNPRFPRVWRTSPVNDMISVCSTEFIVCEAKKEVWTEYLYWLFNSKSFFDLMLSHVTGTTGSRQRVKLKDTLSFRIVIPPEKIIANFVKTVGVLSKQVNMNLEESQNLAKIRDTLLPKLLSGEIRVNDTEKIVGGG